MVMPFSPDPARGSFESVTYHLPLNGPITTTHLVHVRYAWRLKQRQKRKKQDHNEDIIQRNDQESKNVHQRQVGVP